MVVEQYGYSRSCVGMLVACANPAGSDGGGPGCGGSTATVTGDLNYSIQGDATWDSTPWNSVNGKRYNSWELTLPGSDGGTLVMTFNELHESSSERGPDSGTYSLGSLLKIEIDTGSVWYTSSSYHGSDGTVTLSKDPFPNFWTIDVNATGLTDYNGGFADLIASITAVPEDGWVQVELNGVDDGRWTGGGDLWSHDRVELNYFTDDGWGVDVRRGRVIPPATPYEFQTGTWTASDDMIDQYYVDTPESGTKAESMSSITITEVNESESEWRISGNFSAEADLFDQTEKITGAFFDLRIEKD